jgi:penicillin-binding protein 1A
MASGMKLRKILLFGLAVPAAALAIASATAFAGLQVAIRRVPENTFTREGIQRILSRESVVLFADGKTRVGTFFEGMHRDYLPFDSIPRPLVDALVSAEDRNYWTHGGWDVKAFARAMADNVTSGGKWRGGSTLTQQTAKNLFGRTGPLRGKVDELINAYRLERNFTKQEILEFYLNQFYVTGNGHGVSIAARYFFDKEPRDLSLVECAFIAGSVKGPNQYNPFIQGTPERRKAAVEKGRKRTAYVLGQMRRHGKISEAAYRRAIANPPKFKRGDFRFTLSTNMMKVKRLLDGPDMQAILARYGVEDYTAAGLQIYTTLDPEIQRAAEYAVYANLAKLDLVLRGYQPPADTAPQRLSHLEPGAFVTGRIVAVSRRDGATAPLRVRFGATEGLVPRASLEDFFRSWNRHQTGADALPTEREMAAFAARHFRPGALIACAVPYLTPGERRRGIRPDSLLVIAQRPVLQGAAQVMQEGKVLANVGGFGNTGYDRVNQARRQFGSSFKPLVYAAALELGWHPLDPLPNHRQAFQLGDLIYFPKPDHAPEDTVSLAWAGRRSENIASVRLLYHLFDKTDFSGFWDQCRRLGLDPDNFPSRGEFERFVRDSLGVVLDQEHLRELRYQKAAADLAVDLTFDGRFREAGVLRELPYGAGFAREREALESGSPDAEDRIRLRVLARDYLDYAARASSWRRGAPPPWSGSGTGWIAARSESDGRLGLFSQMPGRGWRPGSLDEARAAGDDALFLEGDLSLETLRALEERLRPAEAPGDRYSRENLHASKDFRAQAALRYVTAFSRRLDIASPLDAVLSFPLGVNVITLGEAVNAYQVFQEGARYRTRFGQPQLYIEKILTADGRTIFEDYAEREEIIAERTRRMLEAILASVVRGGTGQRIGRELRMPLGRSGGEAAMVAVPAYGKTGTTNDYRNAAFLGYLAAPKGQGKGFDPAAGYAIGVYTGFDDNRPMSRAGFRGTGASAAIPAWLGIARGIVKIKDYAGRVEVPDPGSAVAGEPPLFQREQYKMYNVSRRTGLPLSRPEDPGYAEDLSDELGPEENMEPAGESSPLWIRED